MEKRKPTDATLRNVRAAHAVLLDHAKRLRLIERYIRTIAGARWRDELDNSGAAITRKQRR